MKLNKLTILMGIGVLAYGSANLALVNTNASLTAPTTYDLHYRPYDNPSPAPDFWELGNQARTSTLQDSSYTRTADGAYWNYSTTLDYNDHVIIPQGLSITMTFNRSNTSWTSTGSGGYYPSDYNKIGNDNNVGNIEKKVYLKFDNQTNKDYFVYFDGSSNLDVSAITWFGVNGLKEGRQNVDYIINNVLSAQFLPSYTSMEIYYDTSSNHRYFDAWYLDDLGVSSAYDNGYGVGYDAGYDLGYDNGYDVGFGDGTSGMGMSSIFTIAFGIVETIFNIQVLGDITLGTIIIAPIAIALLWFILGIVSGVGGKKQ